MGIPVVGLHQGQRTAASVGRTYDRNSQCVRSLKVLVIGGRSLIAPPLSTASCLLLLSPYQGHGSLRGQRLPPQHPVRSAGAAMSTTGSRGNHAAQRPPSQPACTLALAGNPHIRTAVRMDLVKVWSGAHGLWLLRPAERLAGPPDAVQDHRQLTGQRDARLAGAGPLRD